MNENERHINILGSVWTIKEQYEYENELLKNCDGYCDWTTKDIVVCREFNGTLSDMKQYKNKVVRHEIIHAFLCESGLSECSVEAEAWATNEEMVDWFARQGLKIHMAWVEADVAY